MNNFDPLNNLFPKPREEIINMQSYSAPLENRRNLLRLDFNENTLGPSPKVLEALQAINLDEISIYPEYNLLKNFLCDNYLDSRKFDDDEIGIFNGADAAINAIFNCFGEKKSNISNHESNFWLLLSLFRNERNEENNLFLHWRKFSIPHRRI